MNVKLHLQTVVNKQNNKETNGQTNEKKKQRVTTLKSRIIY